MFCNGAKITMKLREKLGEANNSDENTISTLDTDFRQLNPEAADF